MTAIVHEDFSTTLLSMCFALAREGELEQVQPRVYFGPDWKESSGWGELFPLSRQAEVWMCSKLTDILTRAGVRVTREHKSRYGKFKPDIWIQDGQQAIIIENKTGGHRADRECEYLDLLRESAFKTLKRAFIYSVPVRWLSDPHAESNEWWRFVRDKKSDDPVMRAIIPWDDKFVQTLCKLFHVPEWFYDKLPNKIDDDKYPLPGRDFWEP